jgi:3-hydroxyisobutyrate dehydrogenase-like beta-hydroxyacid dehydrogenase
MTAMLSTIGIVSPGDMGHVVGQVLREHGLRVVAALSERSARTQALAQQAGIINVGTEVQLIHEADMLLSILAPVEALSAAARLAHVMATLGIHPLYVDCNAIAPQAAHQINALIVASGGRFVDASIIGPPPRKRGTTRFYASGVHSPAFAQLHQFGLDIVVLGEEIGQASAFKMCYAALTKGFTALCTELLTAAQALGITEPLTHEFRLSQPVFFEQMNRSLPGMPAKARRWVGEMDEIAQTFASLGLTPQILAGAADLYQLVSQTELANRHPEDVAPLPTLTEVVVVLANQLVQSGLAQK